MCNYLDSRSMRGDMGAMGFVFLMFVLCVLAPFPLRESAARKVARCRPPVPLVILRAPPFVTITSRYKIIL